jgi:hypothetical protein
VVQGSLGAWSKADDLLVVRPKTYSIVAGDSDIPIDLLPPMIVLDDPANPFSLIFSIRKIPNDLLDLERLNRRGESVPSRESRTSTLKGLFLLEGQPPPFALVLPTSVVDAVDGCAGRPAKGRRWKSVTVKV